MVLVLKWKDNKGNIYKLGKLYKENKYYFAFNQEGIKKAMKNGCMGIGKMSMLKTIQISGTLFPFFSNRIPQREDYNTEEILKKYQIEKYDEMELLKYTKAMLMTDRYYMEEE